MALRALKHYAAVKEIVMVDMSTLVGAFRRFGLEGPPYEVLGPAGAGADGAPRMRIRVLESGEELDYPVRDISADFTE